MEKDIIKPGNRIDFGKFIVPPPEIMSVSEPKAVYPRKPLKINYLEKEQSNKALGTFGEELVIEYEKWNLIKLGKENLADKIEWISAEAGDSAGFDILSKNIKWY